MADYDSNKGTLNPLAIKTLKNLVIVPETEDYKIQVPKQWVVKSVKHAVAYDKDGNATQDKYLKLDLIKASLAKVIVEEDSIDDLKTVNSISCALPVGYTSSFAIEPLSTIIELDGLVYKPKWVTSPTGNGGGYSALRIEAKGIKQAGSLESDAD